MKDNYEEILKNAKLRVTPARVAILNVFTEGCKPLSAENIASKIKNKVINLVTVYRTLGSLEQAQILKRVDLHSDSVHYELASHHHHHIVCTQCGVIEGFDICEIENVSKKALAQSSKFVSISQHSLELFGNCKRCAKIL